MGPEKRVLASLAQQASKLCAPNTLFVSLFKGMYVAKDLKMAAANKRTPRRTVPLEPLSARSV